MHFRSLMLTTSCTVIAAMHLYRKANLQSNAPDDALGHHIPAIRLGLRAHGDFHVYVFRTTQSCLATGDSERHVQVKAANWNL